jgi:hypothetical protein
MGILTNLSSAKSSITLWTYWYYINHINYFYSENKALLLIHTAIERILDKSRRVL